MTNPVGNAGIGGVKGLSHGDADVLHGDGAPDVEADAAGNLFRRNARLNELFRRSYHTAADCARIFADGDRVAHMVTVVMRDQNKVGMYRIPACGAGRVMRKKGIDQDGNAISRKQEIGMTVPGKRGAHGYLLMQGGTGHASPELSGMPVAEAPLLVVFHLRIRELFSRKGRGSLAVPSCPSSRFVLFSAYSLTGRGTRDSFLPLWRVQVHMRP